MNTKQIEDGTNKRRNGRQSHLRAGLGAMLAVAGLCMAQDANAVTTNARSAETKPQWETSASAGLTLIQDHYDLEPAPGRKKNDLKLVTALAYKF